MSRSSFLASIATPIPGEWHFYRFAAVVMGSVGAVGALLGLAVAAAGGRSVGAVAGFGALLGALLGGALAVRRLLVEFDNFAKASGTASGAAFGALAVFRQDYPTDESFLTAMTHESAWRLKQELSGHTWVAMDLGDYLKPAEGRERND